MDEEIEKQMSSTNKRCTLRLILEKIFNVRKLHYKQYDPHDKCIYEPMCRSETSILTFPSQG